MADSDDESQRQKPPPPGPAAPAEQDVLRDLASFRKSSLGITEEEQRNWQKEALKRRDAPAEAPVEEKKVEEPQRESRWSRIERMERKRKFAIMALEVCALLAVLSLDLKGCLARVKRAFVRAPASPTAAPLPPAAPLDSLRLAEGYLVSRLEQRWLQFRPDPKPFASDPFRYDWAGYKGPPAVFTTDNGDDALDRYELLVPQATDHSRPALLLQIADFLRTAQRPSEQLLTSLIVDDPVFVTTSGQAQLAHNPPDSGRIAFATGLAMLFSGGDPKTACDLLQRATKESDGDDPWPARAFAMVSVALGHAAAAIPALEARVSANPQAEMLGYQLVWLYIQAGKLVEADHALEKLEPLPSGPVARLMRTVLAAAQHDWPTYTKRLEPVDTELATQPKPHQARVECLKGTVIFVRDPNQRDYARETIARALEVDPSCTWPDQALGELNYARKAYGDAGGAYRRILRRNTRSASVRRALARVLFEGQYFSPLLAEVQELVGIDGATDEYARMFGVAADALQRPDLASYFTDRLARLKVRGH